MEKRNDFAALKTVQILVARRIQVSPFSGNIQIQKIFSYSNGDYLFQNNFRIPREGNSVRDEWKRSLSSKGYRIPPYFSSICCMHFKPEDLVHSSQHQSKLKLKKGAIPLPIEVPK